MQRHDDAHLDEGHSDDAYERLFVAGVFALMAVALFVYIWKFGRNVPFWDDWELVPVLTGNTPISLSWLWTPHNEHSIPIVRLVVYSVWRLTGDLRVVMVLTSLMLCAACWAFVESCRRLRGHAAFTDAVFPLALLGWGLFENHIFTIQFFFVGAAVLTVVIVLVGSSDWQGRHARVGAIAVSLVLLPMFGALGLAMLPCMLAWVAVIGVSSVRQPGSCSRREGLVLLLSCGLAMAIAVAYVIGFPENSTGTPGPSLAGVLRTSTEILSTAIGQAGQKLWPYSAVGTIAVVAGAAALAVRAAWMTPGERPRAFVLLAGIGALVSLVVAIAFGRSGLGQGQGFSNRYALFSATLLCIGLVSFSLYARGGLGRFVRTGILLALTAAFVTNTWAGFLYGVDRADRADALTEAIDAGAPPDVAAARHAERLYPIPSILSARLEMLRAARAGPYDREQAFPVDSPCRAADVHVVKLGEHETYVDNGTFRAVGSDPFVVYSIPEAAYVCGVTIQFVVTNASTDAPKMQVFWARSPDEFQEGRRSAHVAVDRTTEVQEATIWIYDDIDRFRIDPDQQPCTFELRSLTFLVRDMPR